MTCCSCAPGFPGSWGPLFLRWSAGWRAIMGSIWGDSRGRGPAGSSCGGTLRRPSTPRRWLSVRWLSLPRRRYTARSAGATTASGATDARTGLGIAGRTAVRGVRKAVAANMTRSRSEIPEATVWVDVDATALVEMRAALKKSDPHNTPGLLAFIARFVTAGLKKYPRAQHQDRHHRGHHRRSQPGDRGVRRHQPRFRGADRPRADGAVGAQRGQTQRPRTGRRDPRGSPTSSARARRPRRNWAAARSR